MPQTKEVEEFLKSIGPFYEIAGSEEEEEMEKDGEKEEGEKMDDEENVSTEKDDAITGEINVHT